MKILLLYFVLVGVPVVGIYGIVCLGQDLKPPMSVGGEWTVELTPRTADMLPCKDFSSESLILKVTQTGRHLVLTLNDPSATRLSGEVNFETLTARSVEQTEPTPGTPGMTSSIQLHADIHRQPGLDRLSGTLTFANCPELSFTAIRRQKGAGGGH
jgi:hypothetical protein